MIIRSSDQVPRSTLLDRFPVPKNLGVAAGSRIDRGRTWPAPAGRSDLDQEQGRSDAHVPSLVPRGHLRLLPHEHRRDELAMIPLRVAMRFACVALAVAGMLATLRVFFGG